MAAAGRGVAKLQPLEKDDLPEGVDDSGGERIEGIVVPLVLPPESCPGT